MKTSKTAVAISIIQGKIFSIAGYCVAVFMLLAIWAGISELLKQDTSNLTGLIAAVILFALGILAILKGIQIKRRVKRFRKYISLISLEHMTSLDDLALNTEKPVDFVRKDLQKMIDKKFFVNALINLKTGEIIIQGLVKPQQAQMNFVVCKNCGAKGRINEGKISECEYCGSILE